MPTRKEMIDAGWDPKELDDMLHREARMTDPWKETCSVHGCEMDGEYCYECEKEVRELVDSALEDFAEGLADPVQPGQKT